MISAMKTTQKLISILLLIAMAACIFAGCQGESATTAGPTTKPLDPWVDYVSQVQLDRTRGTAQLEVTVKQHVDGDTTHFYINEGQALPEGVLADRVLKVRYVAVNTPESTGAIEPWGKKASNFTREKLDNAESIIVESNTATWETDSSGSRFMGWVWYKTKGESEYRLLNLELVQEGLSLASGSTTDIYGSYTGLAYIQAQNYKLYVFSSEKDPDYYDGEALPVDIKSLRTNPEAYLNKRVYFTGVITRYYKNTAYVEQYDEETDSYYGMNVFDGYISTAGNILCIGNEVLFVGSFQYYEAGGTYQLTDISYNPFSSDTTNDLKLVGTGNKAPNRLTDADTFVNGKVTLNLPKEEGEGFEEKEFSYAELAMSTSIAMNNLKVKRIYTTNNGGKNDGAMTLTCEVDGIEVVVRTFVLYDDNKQMLTADDFMGKTIDVTGIVDYYEGQYQIKVFSAKNITVHE